MIHILTVYIENNILFVWFHDSAVDADTIV